MVLGYPSESTDPALARFRLRPQFGIGTEHGGAILRGTFGTCRKMGLITAVASD